MRVRMKKTVEGAADGFTLVKFEDGKEYDLSSTARAKELAQVFIQQGWADEVGGKVSSPTGKKVRLPLRDEFVAAGYHPDNYEKFIKSRTQEAELAGDTVEIRSLTAEEIAAQNSNAAAEKAAAPSVKHAAEIHAAPTPPRPPAPPPVTEDSSKKKHRR